MAGSRRHSAEVRRWQLIAAGSLPGLGLVGLLLYTTGVADPVSALGAGLMISGATAVAGGGLGFLFGIPRALGSAGSSTQQGGYTANTNLEQVSDWLTKILLGVGLTQLGSLWEKFRSLGHALAPALGGRGDSAPFAAALVLYFLVLGFLGGWLLTRLMLADALTEADGNALALFTKAQEQQRAGNVVGAEDLRVQAMGHLGQFATQAAPQSTVTAAAAAEIRAGAKSSTATPEEVRGLFTSDDENLRMQALALTQGNAALGDFESVLDYIEHPRTAFEHYNALLAARG